MLGKWLMGSIENDEEVGCDVVEGASWEVGYGASWSVEETDSEEGEILCWNREESNDLWI